tara:strand:+ start:256 stop:642 length:387 start_codon:yes stop_codon:yes gene_type:complete
LNISIKELELFIHCVGYGLGEGAMPCYYADEKTIPDILTRNNMIYLDYDNGPKILPASEFFTESVSVIASKAFKVVFNKNPKQHDLIKALNYTPSDYKDFLEVMKPSEYTVEQFVRYFEKAKERLTEE